MKRSCGDTVKDAASYMAVLTRPWMLARQTGRSMCCWRARGIHDARRLRELANVVGRHRRAAVTVTLAVGLVSGRVRRPAAVDAPVLLVTTGPAMLAGAWIRMQARLALESVPAASRVGTGSNAGRETP